MAQLAPVPGDLSANAGRLEQELAAHPDAELAVFPELYLTGYEPKADAGMALSEHDPPVHDLREAAARHETAVIVGLIERTAAGAVANAAVCIDRDGALAGIYRKTHLFGDAEERAFVAGDDPGGPARRAAGRAADLLRRRISRAGAAVRPCGRGAAGDDRRQHAPVRAGPRAGDPGPGARQPPPASVRQPGRLPSGAHLRRRERGDRPRRPGRRRAPAASRSCSRSTYRSAHRPYPTKSTTSCTRGRT